MAGLAHPVELHAQSILGKGAVDIRLHETDQDGEDRILDTVRAGERDGQPDHGSVQVIGMVRARDPRHGRSDREDRHGPGSKWRTARQFSAKTTEKGATREYRGKTREEGALARGRPSQPRHALEFPDR